MTIQSPEVLSRLDALAVKLGVAASHIWAVLVRQAYVEAAGAGMFFLIMVALTVAAVRIVRYGRTAEWYDGSNDIAFLATGIGVLALAVSWIIALVALVCGVQSLLNPEYFALHAIFEAVK